MGYKIIGILVLIFTTWGVIMAILPSRSDTSRYYTCPKCGTTRKRGTPRCPACGFRDDGGSTIKVVSIVISAIIIAGLIITLPSLLGILISYFKS